MKIYLRHSFWVSRIHTHSVSNKGHGSKLFSKAKLNTARKVRPYQVEAPSQKSGLFNLCLADGNCMRSNQFLKKRIQTEN